MGAQVTWDGATKSVHIWDKMVPGDTSSLDVCKPYDSELVYLELSSDGDIFKMDGELYSNGMTTGQTIAERTTPWALFNLDGRFRTLSFDIGHSRNISKEKNISFIVDGKMVKTLTLEPEQFVEHVTIPLNSGLQLKIVCGYGVGIANMIVE